MITMLPGDEAFPLITHIMVTEEVRKRHQSGGTTTGSKRVIERSFRIYICIALHNFHHQRANVTLDNDNGPGSWSKLRQGCLETRWKKTMILMVSEMVMTVSQGYCGRNFFKQRKIYI